MRPPSHRSPATTPSIGVLLASSLYLYAPLVFAQQATTPDAGSLLQQQHQAMPKMPARLPQAELQATVQTAVGQDIGFAGLEQLADAATRHLKDTGWLLARAYLLQQDLTEGNLEINLALQNCSS